MTFPVPWDRDEHTAAKHAVMEGYLKAWFPILLQSPWFTSATYAEGFAGPGIYTKSEPGSPIIAMRVLLERQDWLDLGKPVRFLFNDLDQRCVDLLAQRIQAEFPDRWPPHVSVRQYKGKAADQTLRMLDENGAWGQPIFAVFDSWGSVAVPLDVVRRIASNKAGEVLVTLGPRYFVQFGTSVPDDSVDATFGGDQTWRAVDGLPAEQKRSFIAETYRAALRRAGFKFLLSFDLVDPRGQELYLLFGTNNERGLEKMKDAMWNADPSTGVRYRDPKDPDQALLPIEPEPQLGPLRRELLEQLPTDGGAATIEDLQRYTLFETVFKATHVITAVTQMVQMRQVKVSPSGRITKSSWVERAR